MKAFILLTLLTTLVVIFIQYSRSRNLKKLLIALATFGAVISLGIMGNITRQIMPLFMVHLILMVLSWGGLIFYLIRGKYYWWIIFSPVLSLGLFLILEFLTGSGHELM